MLNYLSNTPLAYALLGANNSGDGPRRGEHNETKQAHNEDHQGVRLVKQSDLFWFRRIVEGEWLFILAGVPSMLLGAFLVFYPVLGVSVLIVLVGVYAILIGVVGFTLSLTPQVGVRR